MEIDELKNIGMEKFKHEMEKMFQEELDTDPVLKIQAEIILAHSPDFEDLMELSWFVLGAGLQFMMDYPETAKRLLKVKDN